MFAALSVFYALQAFHHFSQYALLPVGRLGDGTKVCAGESAGGGKSIHLNV